MTKIEITIQEKNGQSAITWMEQKGDMLPQELWDDFNITIASAVERYLNN